MSENTRKIIDFTLGDQGKEARDALYAEIHDRVMDKFEHLKSGIAQSVIAREDYVKEDGKEGHEDEKEDKALVKKMVKKDCLTKEGIEDSEDDYDEEEEEEEEEEYEWDESEE